MQEVVTKFNCYHCGDDCQQDNIVVEDKHFCCQGCKTVFEVLNANGLCGYYDLEENPGIKIKAKSLEKYAYLDEPTISAQFYDFNENNIVKVKFYIPSIHCSSCIWLLENLNRLKDGVLSSRVDFVNKELYITFNDSFVSFRTIVELLESVGYAPHLNLEKSEHKENYKVADKSLIYKIGITSFCAGNIMLLSFPEYFGIEDIVDYKYKYFFAYLNLVLALPALLYGASGYFISAFNVLKNRKVNVDVPIMTGITALFSRSAYEVITQTGPGYFDSFTGLLLFLLIGKWFQGKSYEALSFERDYKSYFPVAVTLVKDGIEKFISIKDIKVGDLLFVRNNELIPADVELISEKASIDYSFVTGESDPVTKIKGEHIFAGGKQLGEGIYLKVKKEVSNSYMLQLWNQESYHKNAPSKVDVFVEKFSAWFIIGVITIALSTFTFWYFTDQSLMWYATISVLVVACPCAFALAAPFALGYAIRKFGQLGFYFKNYHSIEKIADIDTIVFDKTGTLTSGDKSTIVFEGTPLSHVDKVYIKSVVRMSTHPLSKIINTQIQAEYLNVDVFNETASKGILAKVGVHEIKVGSADFVGTTQVLHEDQNAALVHVMIDQVYKGYFIVKQNYRPQVDELLNTLKDKYEIHLLSGDNASERFYLAQWFKQDRLLFNQSPTDKLAYIKKLEEAGKSVLMIGDGLNDAGALKQANLGFSIADDVYHFSPACDVIIEAKSFNKLTYIIEKGKQFVSLVKWSIIFAILYNIVGMYFATQAKFTPLVAAIMMPVSSVITVGLVVWTSYLITKKRLN